MLVVIPVCAKDIHLAERNLELCKALEPTTQFQTLIAYEHGTSIDRLVQLASGYFSSLVQFGYDHWTGKSAWPGPQNYAWQTVARRCALQSEPWLWWEPDATPLRAGWLKELDAEYRRVNRPFMGHIVPSMGHMNGVAIYPPDVARFSTNAMLCRAAAWDVTLWEDIKNGGKAHSANHLMAHVPRRNGIVLHVAELSVAKRLTERHALFHGCNDGSLANLLLGRKPDRPPENAITRIYGDADLDGDNDESNAVWEHDAIELSRRGYAIRSLDEYRQDIPSVTRQTPWPCGIIALPTSPVSVHFNPAIVDTRKGLDSGLALITRRWTRTPAGPWQSDLIAWTLDDDLYPTNPIELKFPKSRPGHQREDPRAISAGNKVLTSYAHWQQARNYTAQQAFAWFANDWSFQSGFSIAYGGNGWSETLTGSSHEKNWTPFFHDGVLHIVYSLHPTVVLRVDSPTSLKKFETKLDHVPWAYGELRGGTPPIRIGNEYVTFPHSAHAWRGRQKRYVTTALTFAAKPPFAIKRLCREPILAGSEHDRVFLKGPPTAFATGAVMKGDNILLVGGVCDERVFALRIPWNELDKRLKPV